MKIAIRSIFIISCFFFYLVVKVAMRIEQIALNMTPEQYAKWDWNHSTPFESILTGIFITAITYFVWWTIASIAPNSRMAQAWEWLHDNIEDWRKKRTETEVKKMNRPIGSGTDTGYE